MRSPPAESLRLRVILGVAGAAAMLVLLTVAASRGLSPSVSNEPASPSAAPAPTASEPTSASPPPSLPTAEAPPSSSSAPSSAPIAAPAVKTAVPLPALPPAMPAGEARMGRSPRAARGALRVAECDDPFFTDANGLRQLKPQCIDR